MCTVEEVRLNRIGKERRRTLKERDGAVRDFVLHEVVEKVSDLWYYKKDRDTVMSMTIGKTYLEE